jgi:hypothetical protein
MHICTTLWNTLAHLPVKRQPFAWSFDVLVAWQRPTVRILSQLPANNNTGLPSSAHLLHTRLQRQYARAHLLVLPYANKTCWYYTISQPASQSACGVMTRLPDRTRTPRRTRRLSALVPTDLAFPSKSDRSTQHQLCTFRLQRGQRIPYHAILVNFFL